MSYLDDLKDRRWAKKRSKVFKRDGFRCTCCGNEGDICAHHTFYYTIHVKPWEYPEDSLITLCGECHRHYHETHEITIKDNPKPRRKKQNKKTEKSVRGIPYPKNLSLANKVEFKKKWLAKKKNPYY